MTNWIKGNVGKVVAALFALAGVLVTVGMVWARSEDTRAAVKDHEPRIRALEVIAPMVRETREDVRAIRNHLIKGSK